MEVPAHGAQGDPATAPNESLQAIETSEELFCPSVQEVADLAWQVVSRIMGKGSDKSVFGQWYHTDSRRYNADRAINHICQAMMQIDGNRKTPDANNEGPIDHLERALVRSVFLLYKTIKGKTQ
jgi:hypothetical protein